MPTTDDTILKISINTSEDHELITLRFKSEERNILVGFNLQEAQLLSLMLSEAVTDALIQKMRLFPEPPETQH